MEKQNEVTAEHSYHLSRVCPIPKSTFFHTNSCVTITSEWLVGNFAGIGFIGHSESDAAESLIEYLYRHICHDSIVGQIVTQSGFPNLKSVRNYLINKDNGKIKN